MKKSKMEVINWLNANSGAIIGVATVVLVGITGYYASLMLRLLKANDTPEIAVSLRPHEAYINLVALCIENIGTSAARDVQFVTNPASILGVDIPLEEISFIKNGIAYFESGRKIEHFLVNVIDQGKLEELKQTPFEVTVTYKDFVKRGHERSFSLDFGADEGLARIAKPPLFEIAEATKQIQKDLHNFTTGTGLRKPIVLTESLTQHRRGKQASSLEIRIEQLPREAQEEILSQIAVAVNRKEQEIRERKWQEQAAAHTKKEAQ